MNTLHEGRVAVSHGNECVVETPLQGALVRCRLRRKGERPVCGDWVRWRDTGDGGGVVESVAPRRTLIERPDFRGRPRPMVANADQVVIVAATEPAPDHTLIERFIILAHHLEIDVVVWLNKSDRLPAGELREPADFTVAYSRRGIEAGTGSVKQHLGLDWLREHLADRSSVLVGQSGVGKSSLLNALIPEREVRVGALSTGSGQGRHTTTATTLFTLPQGGAIIDSPGVRDLKLGHLGGEAVREAFPEIVEAAKRCRFGDCRHDQEPGCGVHAALKRGEITSRRLEQFRVLMAEVAAFGRV